MPSGKRIKEIRIKKGLTQKQLGDMCGMADSAIRRYENGNANPKIETLKKIAKALDVPLYEFLYNKEIIDGETATIIDLSDMHTSEAIKTMDYIQNELHSNNKNKPLTSYFENDGFTDDEIQKILEYAEFIKSQRK